MDETKESTAAASVAAVVERYLELRDEKTKIQEETKKRLETVNARMTHIENALMGYMEKTGLDSLPTSAGTAYQSSRTRAKVVDWDQVTAYVAQHKAWHILARRLSDEAVRELAEAGTPVPGSELSTFRTVNIRRS